MTIKKKILTPMDERWDEFMSSLMSHLNIQEEYDNYDEMVHFSTGCDASFRITRNVLKNRFSGYDCEATIGYFQKNEWYCDCETFLNSPCGLGQSKVELAQLEAQGECQCDRTAIPE
jgi:hypothetical protein